MWQHFITGIAMLFLWPGAASAGMIVVRPGSGTNAIPQALGLAKGGDTILILSGRYPVSDLMIDKPVTLIGSGYPVLDGEMKGEVLVILSDHVVIAGLQICNTNKGSMKNYAGIRCNQVSGVRILNNRFDNALFPIYLVRSSNGLIRGNTIRGGATSTASGSGIYLWYSSLIRVDSNSISGQRDGIYLEFSSHCTVSRNLSENNYRYGLHFMFSNNDSYSENKFINNGSGVAVMYSRDILMLQNRFEHNRGQASYGLLLKEINSSRIAGNAFKGNTTGIFMEGSGRNHFERNQFLENGWAVRVMGDCSANEFRTNRFAGNTFDVSTNSSRNENLFDGNFWDKYEGYDLNKDGVGDVPFRPVSLYGTILEQVPYAIILLHSLVVNLADRAERSIPSLNSSPIEDNHPLMKYRQP